MSRRGRRQHVQRSMTEDEREKRRSLQVKMMASTDSSPAAMASVLNISLTDLRKQYSDELKYGKDFVYAAMSCRFVEAGFKGDLRAQLEWFRNMGGWREITRREITGKNGEPISFQHLDSASLSEVIKALGEAGIVGGGRRRATPTIDAGTDRVTDLDPIPGTADEGSGK